MSIPIRWEDPPPDGRRFNSTRNNKLNAFRAELIANPGRWALLAEVDRSSQISKRHSTIMNSLEGWRGYRWEAVTRQVDGKARLYVRCLGPISEVQP